MININKMSLLSVKKSSLTKYILIFVLIDILFLPYFPIVIMPLSLPILFFYYLFIGFQIKIDLDFKMWVFFLIMVILSIFYGFTYPYLSDYFVDNMKYFLFLTSAVFYFCFYNYNYNQESILLINNILKIFILYVTALSFFLIIDPLFIMEFISSLYGELAGGLDGFLFDLRFKYFFQDANTFAYFMLLVLGFLFHTHKKNFQLLLLSILVLFTIIMTQSSGGLLGYLLINIIYFFKRVLKTTLVNKIFLLIIIMIIFISIIFFIISFKEENIYFSVFYERMFESDDRINSGGGRFKIWSELFNLFPLPIGKGYNIYIPELYKIRSPHSDLFGMIYRYGFFSLFPLIYFFYKKLKSSYYILIPALITFLINSLFDSQKLLILFFILTIISHKFFLKKISDD